MGSVLHGLRLLRDILFSGLFALILSSVSARGAETSEDIVDCSTTVDRFEIVLCSNHGALDLLNHIHQMLAFAPDPDAARPSYSAFQNWVQSIATRCMGRDPRLASDCIYDLAAGDEAASFLGDIELLYANESDIEGDEECDGCEEAVAVASPEERATAHDTEQRVETTDDSLGFGNDPQVLDGVYVAYLTAIPCRDNGYVENSVVSNLERAAKQAEQAFDEATRDARWKKAVETTNLTNTIFSFGDYEHIKNACDYAALVSISGSLAAPGGVPKPF